MSLAGLDGTLLASAIAALLTAALLPLAATLVARAPAALRVAVPRALGLVGSLAITVLGALALANGPRTVIEWYPGFPTQPFTLMADLLAGPFLLVLGLVSSATFLTFATDDARGGARARVALHAGFTLAMLAVLVARHTLLFLLAWEGMTLLSGVLVAHDTTRARARQATFTYLGLSHAGAACVALALLTLSTRGGGFGFEAIASAFAQQPPAEAARLMALLTLGFAVKLGVVPLHVWLPLAHPEAPPAASASMSGVMVKLGLYGLLRFVWQLPGAPPHGWGTVLLLAGIATALTGALYATIESDTKRLLAWSTVKHTGVLTLATGLAALLAEAGRADLAGVALAAVFVHTIGHGLSKAAAFLAFGEAVHATGVRSLEGLGGLARRMPGTAWAALLATLSLAGLPLFACFTGEWLLVQALLLGFSAGAGTLRLLAPFAAAGLALASALALAALVKLYGIAFLGRARSLAALNAHEIPAGRANLLFAVALLPLLVGVGGPWLAALFARPVQVLLPGFEPASLARLGGLLLVPAGLAPSSVSPFVLAMLGAMFVALAVWGLRGRGRVRTVRRAPSWACGARLEPQMQYSALGYTKPLRLVFEPVLLSGSELEVLEEGSPYFARRLRHRSVVPQWVEQWLYRPFVTAVLRTSEQARRVQAGSLHVYLGYLLATLVALLLWGR